ncbi:hypothetical protein BJ986_000197 [Phycicoccus badiiscoriae]|uniref:Uncharacterized protein n=1 Tax=Pedococcus badiiscoriae TaxID=642776 RepID=A0A852WAR1_9MICO|nr:hypothetical protein [Pedococcus badiiscoriae]NYG05710.1 hypothetical protein [Pedococcus badiiscoriae]
MEYDETQVRDAIAAVRVGGQTPPRLVYEALVSLTSGRSLELPVATMTKADGHVHWRVLALVGDALVSVHGEHEGVEWTFGSEPDDSRQGVLREARVVRLDEVVACHVTGTEAAPTYGFQTASLYEWIPSWAISLRDGSRIEIPQTDRTHDVAASIAAKLRARLAG